MTTRQASCACGQLQLACEGEPLRISICHCLDCQKRTGAPFGMQARFPRANVRLLAGESQPFTRPADSGNSVTFHFCPQCGSTLYWELSAYPEVFAVAVGAFADPHFPAPRISVYENRRHHWVDLEDLAGIERI